MESKLGIVTHTNQEQYYWVKLDEVIKLFDEVLSSRRGQINLMKDEEMIAHLHTFVNHFEDEIKLKLSYKTGDSK